MSLKQDRQGVRSATDLEQKYNFGKSFAEVMGLATDARDTANAAKGAIDNLDNDLDSDEIFNRLTENGALQGLYKEDGNIYINASYIKSGRIYTVYSQVYLATDYTEDDITTMRSIMMGTVTASAEQTAKYDINGDGVITSSEVIYVRNMVLSGKDVTVSWKCLLNPSDSEEMFKVWREIEKPDSSGNMTVTETVMFCAGVGTGVAPAFEADSYSGCYYRMVDGVQEWINPPMVVGTEYRTTERWGNKAVYRKLVQYTDTSGFAGDNLHTIPHGISDMDRSYGVEIVARTQGFQIPYIASAETTAVTGCSATNIELRTTGTTQWSAGRVWYFDMKYVKSV